MKKDIYLVRHAESEANVGVFKKQGKKVNGPEYIKLTKNGKLQAKDLAKKVKKVNKIFVSTYTRTHDTAKPLAKRFTKGKLHISKHIHEFTYMNFGASKGKNIEELKKQAIDFWVDPKPHVKIGPKSESFKDFVERIQFFLNGFKKFPEGTYIFTHKNVILTMMILFEDFPHKLNKKLTKEELQIFMNKLKEKRNKAEIGNAEIVDIADYLK
jgi:alpha-ribazole phosphatase